jgi:hypothetical protein
MTRAVTFLPGTGGKGESHRNKRQILIYRKHAADDLCDNMLEA